MSTELIQSLCNPAVYPHPVERVRIEETHISWVLLTGSYAYKIKKPVNLGFLDYSTLARRRFCCGEELRLNSRFAPQLYLDVVAIGGSSRAPELPARGPAIEYAVRMREFPADARLDLRLAAGQLDSGAIDRLAAVVAGIHDTAPRSTAADTYGEPAQVCAPVDANFTTLQPLLSAAEDLRRLESIRTWSRRRQEALTDLLAARKRDGYVRECHGDLHLGNIAWVDDTPVLFDGIEFNPALRWIDVMSECAFLSMDLIDRRRADLAWRWLNAYLAITGDYAGCALLRFYQAYRAVVRAKVAMLRKTQCAAEAEIASAIAQAGEYLALATEFTHPPPSVLVFMHGLSGTGKTFCSQRLLERIGAIRLRSDIERKRMAGLGGGARSGSGLDTGLYTREKSRETYARLRVLAGDLAIAGQRVIVDAACLKREQRDDLRRLAADLHLPHVFVCCQAEEELLRERIAGRTAAARDASEAGIEVLDAQLRHQDRIAADEQRDCLFIDSRDPQWLERVCKRISSLPAAVAA